MASFFENQFDFFENLRYTKEKRKGGGPLDYPQNCSFSGHRPERLPWGYQEDHPDCLALKQQIQDLLGQLYHQGYHHFISGMAQGSDLYFAEAVLDLRGQYPQVVLECARPCETQAESWPAPLQKRYQEILATCNFETLVQHHYSPGCMMRRNRYMVEHSSVLVAVYDGNAQGGTAQTLAYALKRGLTTHILGNL